MRNLRHQRHRRQRPRAIAPPARLCAGQFRPDGHGGYLKSGSRLNAGSTNTDEITNAHYNSSGSATTYGASYVKKTPPKPASSSDDFDDLVRFKERWQMMTGDDPYNRATRYARWGAALDGYYPQQAISMGSLTAGTGTAFADVNGDGIPDHGSDTPTNNWAAWTNTYRDVAYVVFGTKTGFSQSAAA